MAGDNEKGVLAVESKQHAVASDSPDYLSDSQDAAFLQKQTRTRRLFNSKQLFASSLVYMGSWNAAPANMYYSMYNGGPSAWFGSYIICAIGAMFQVAAFSEFASIQPIAGAQYYWTFHFATPRTKLFLTWLQGWVTWTAYIATMTSSLNYGTAILGGIIELNYPEFEVNGWRTTLISLATLAVVMLFNLFAFRILPAFELVSGFINVGSFLIYVIVFLVMSPKNGTEVFTTPNVSSGWDNYFIATHIGAISNIWCFIGFDAVIHMGEETKNSKEVVPRALFWSLATNAVLGLIMVLVTMFCLPPVDDIVNATSPIVAIGLHATGSIPLTTFIAALQCIMSYTATMVNVASVSRLTWAWARDGALPQCFGYVDGKYRIPFRAVLLTAFIVALLTLLNLGSATYVALGAITSLSSMAVFLSYAMILAIMLRARLSGTFELGPWNWGRYGTLINVVALVYSVYGLIWFPFPQTIPVDASVMNYCGPVLGAVLVFAVSLWFVRRKTWKGPNRAIVDIVLHNEE